MYEKLRKHVGHKIACVQYGEEALNVAIECETCGEVLVDCNHPMVEVLEIMHQAGWKPGYHSALDDNSHRITTMGGEDEMTLKVNETGEVLWWDFRAVCRIGNINDPAQLTLNFAGLLPLRGAEVEDWIKVHQVHSTDTE